MITSVPKAPRSRARRSSRHEAQAKLLFLQDVLVVLCWPRTLCCVFVACLWSCCDGCVACCVSGCGCIWLCVGGCVLLVVCCWLCTECCVFVVVCYLPTALWHLLLRSCRAEVERRWSRVELSNPHLDRGETKLPDVFLKKSPPTENGTVFVASPAPWPDLGLARVHPVEPLEDRARRHGPRGDDQESHGGPSGGVARPIQWRCDDRIRQGHPDDLRSFGTPSCGVTCGTMSFGWWILRTRGQVSRPSEASSPLAACFEG